MTVLIALQSASISRTLRDRNEQQAMLIARSLMSSFESGVSPLELQDREVPVIELFEELRILDSATDVEKIRYNDFTARLVVDYWDTSALTGLGIELSAEALKRVELSIFWGPNPNDSFNILAFVPNDEGTAVEEGVDEEEL